MTQNTVQMQGTLQPDGKLILDEKPAMPPGRVRVALQAISVDATPARDVLAVLNEIHAAQKLRGHVPRTREEIDAMIAAMRDEDEERMQALERLHEESQRQRHTDSGSEQ